MILRRDCETMRSCKVGLDDAALCRLLPYQRQRACRVRIAYRRRANSAARDGERGHGKRRLGGFHVERCAGKVPAFGRRARVRFARDRSRRHARREGSSRPRTTRLAQTSPNRSGDRRWPAGAHSRHAPFGHGDAIRSRTARRRPCDRRTARSSGRDLHAPGRRGRERGRRRLAAWARSVGIADGARRPTPQRRQRGRPRSRVHADGKWRVFVSQRDNGASIIAFLLTASDRK